MKRAPVLAQSDDNVANGRRVQRRLRNHFSPNISEVVQADRAKMEEENSELSPLRSKIRPIPLSRMSRGKHFIEKDAIRFMRNDPLSSLIKEALFCDISVILLKSSTGENQIPAFQGWISAAAETS